MNNRDLPIYEIAPGIVDALRNCRNLVISAPTGSGKSTQLPQILLPELPEGKQMLVLQPRRLPARVCAERVAYELGEKIGGRIGYITRFERKISAESKVIFITEGILTRMLMSPRDLQNVAIIVFDEFHERSINADLGIALARQLQNSSRSDLHLIAMSATLEPAPLIEYLGGAAECRYLQSSGRLYPVSITYTNRSSQINLYQSAANALREVAVANSDGDILIFMPGVAEIRHCIEECERRCSNLGLQYYPLYGEMSPEEQHQSVFGETTNGCRRVIVATNIAETSLTIPTVHHVIDSGLVKQNRFDSMRGVNVLELRPISRDSADQRAGRAGRTAAGTCRRLWSELEQNGRPQHTLPEIQRIDLCDAVLTIAFAGYSDTAKFAWYELPPEKMLDNACRLLQDIGLLDKKGITAIGREVRHYPVHPRLGLLLWLGQKQGCFRQCCMAAALLSEKRPDNSAPARSEANSDFEGYFAQITRGNASMPGDVIRAYKDYLALGRPNAEAAVNEAFLKCLIQAFPDYLARRIKGEIYELPGRRRASLTAGSRAAGQDFVVAAELHEIATSGTNGSKIEMSLVSGIKADWLWEIYGDDLAESEEVFWDNQKQQVFGRRLLTCRGLVLEENISNQPDSAAASELLAQQLDSNNMQLLGWDESCDAWIERVQWLADIFPEQNLPKYEDADVAKIRLMVCQGETSYRAIRNKPCLQYVKGILPADKIAFVEKMAPATLPLPRGRKLKIEYHPGQTPRGRARIQELYDLQGPVVIAGGRVKILLDILAPNMRTVQITDDLPRFWQVHYPALKSALARRYPKHEWR